MPRKPIPMETLSSEAQQLYAVLSRETDLACVVLGAALLDSALASLLKAKLLESSVTDKMLASNGVLGSFDARTDLAYCLSLIDKNSYRDLCLIGQIRNQFAHSHLNLTFAEDTIQKLSKELLSPEARLSSISAEVEAGTREWRMVSRNRFEFTVIIIANELLSIGEKFAEGKGTSDRGH